MLSEFGGDAPSPMREGSFPFVVSSDRRDWLASPLGKYFFLTLLLKSISGRVLNLFSPPQITNSLREALKSASVSPFHTVDLSGVYLHLYDDSVAGVCGSFGV